MKTIKEYNVKIPTYALSYLVNGDSSGLEQDDKQAIDKYMSDFYSMVGKDESLIFSVDTVSNEEGEELEQDAYFTWHPAFGLACDVADCTILIVAS